MNKQSANLPGTPVVQAARSLRQAPFVLGRQAFAKIAAVEGIRPNIDMEAELLMRDDVEFDARRDALSRLASED